MFRLRLIDICLTLLLGFHHTFIIFIGAQDLLALYSDYSIAQPQLQPVQKNWPEKSKLMCDCSRTLRHGKRLQAMRSPQKRSSARVSLSEQFYTCQTIMIIV